MNRILSENKGWVGVIVASLTIASLSIVYAMNKSDGVSSRRKAMKDPKVINLLLGEKEGMIHAPSVSTITFYRFSDDKGDFDTVRRSLEQRMREILRCNPWLKSRLSSSREHGLVAIYDANENENDVSNHFSVAHDSKLTSDSSFPDISKRTLPYLVRKGMNCIDKDFAQFLVTLVDIRDQGKACDSHKNSYALVISLSHVIGDGHTFYNIVSMLSDKSKVFSLDANRNNSFMSDLDRVSDPNIQKWLQTPYLIFGIITTLLMRKTPQTAIFEVDNSLVAQIKDKYCVGCDNNSKQTSESANSLSVKNTFVSTNDIMTSWFLRTMHDDYGLMAINYRNRISGYDDSMAGNYEGVLLYSNDDVRTADQVRSSLKTFRSQSGRIPSVIETLMFNVGCVTNWSSFYRDVSLPCSETDMHLPLVDVNEAIFRDLLVLFRTGRGDQMGALLMLRNRTLDSVVKSVATPKGLNMEDQPVLGQRLL